jgi:hypothetical protein
MINKLFLLSLFCLGVAGCGVKPSEIEPPDEVKNKEFPRTYPDLNTDPPPYTVPRP